MLLTTKMKAAPAGLTVLILLVLTASTLGQSAKRSARRQLADQLKDFKYTAYAMLQEADTLIPLSRAGACNGRVTPIG